MQDARDRRHQHDRARTAVRHSGTPEKQQDEDHVKNVRQLPRVPGSGFRGLYRGRVLQRHRVRARLAEPRRPAHRRRVGAIGRGRPAVRGERGQSQRDRMLAAADHVVVVFVAATDRRHRRPSDGQRDPEKYEYRRIQFAEDGQHTAGRAHHHRVRLLHRLPDDRPRCPQDVDQRVRPVAVPTTPIAPARGGPIARRKQFQFRRRWPHRRRGAGRECLDAVGEHDGRIIFMSVPLLPLCSLSSS